MTNITVRYYGDENYDYYYSYYYDYDDKNYDCCYNYFNYVDYDKDYE